MKDAARIRFTIFYAVFTAIVAFVFDLLFLRRSVGYSLGAAAFVFLLVSVTNLGVMVARRRNEQRTKHE